MRVLNLVLNDFQWSVATVVDHVDNDLSRSHGSRTPGVSISFGCGEAWLEDSYVGVFTRNLYGNISRS